jgi:hypothetical protein
VVDVDTGGVDLCHIREYRKVDVCCVRLRLDLAARDAVSLYARQYVGQSYDVKGFLWLALSVLLGDRLRVPDTGKPGCTSLVVRALERGGLRFDRPAPEMMPADLAKKFGVLP